MTQIVLENSDLANKINNVISVIIVFISSIFVTLAFIPFAKFHYYDYSTNEPRPILRSSVVSPIHLTLNNGNPIVIIIVITLSINIVLSILTFKFKKNVWVKLCNYILFVINLFLMFFLIVFVVIYCSNNAIDFA